MAAPRKEEPDRVPFCELAVDRALAERLMGWPASGKAATGSLMTNPCTVEESKALAAFLACDSLTFLLRTPTYAKTQMGKEGRAFVGNKVIGSA